MRLQRETDLNDTEAKQNKTDGTDKTEDEIGQIVDHGNRVACGKSGNAHTANKSCCCDYGAVSTEAFLNLSGHRQLLSGFLFVVLLKNVHCVFLR